MKKLISFFSRSQRGSVLLIVLALVVLVTALIVSILLLARFERSAASLALNRKQSEILANYAADIAIGRLQQAIDAGREPGKAWASMPGRIAVFDLAAGTPTFQNLFSALPGPDAPKDVNNVDLNRAAYSGLHPVTGSAPGTMKIGWTNILQDPTAPASKANPIVARVAWWVDDESCKVNVNTADGSAKNDTITEQAEKVSNVIPGKFGVGHFSYGFGVPSEISLQAFPAIDKNTAANIADYATANGFNTAAEVVRAPGVPTSFYQDNKFSLTQCNRTPELTFFGEPRIYLFPTTQLSNGSVRIATAGAYGGPALSSDDVYKGTDINYNIEYKYLNQGGDGNIIPVSGAIDFIYPTSKQLPQMSLPVGHQPVVAQDLPQFTPFSRSVENNLLGMSLPYLTRMAYAIYGFNSLGGDIPWPRLSGSSGFKDKYSIRQIDDITLQILDISNSNVMTDQEGRVMTFPAISIDGIIDDPDYKGRRTVTGLGRGPKMTEIYLRAIVSGSTSSEIVYPPPADPPPAGTPPLKTYKHPLLQIYTTVEFLIPKYFEGLPLHYPYCRGDYKLKRQWGNGGYEGFNNVDSNPAGDAPTTRAKSELGTFWSDTLFKVHDQDGNPGGFDLTGNALGVTLDPNAYDPNDPNNPQNPKNSYLRALKLAVKDPDRDPDSDPDSDPYQPNAALYHPWTYNPITKKYNSSIDQPYDTQFSALGTGSSGMDPSHNMTPGTYHSFDNPYAGVPKPGKAGILTGIQFRGGLSLITGPTWEQFEAVPIDNLRTNGYTAETAISIKTELEKAVIPVHLDIPLGVDGVLNAGQGSIILRTSDPLVNQFPKDWESRPDVYQDTDPDDVTLLLWPPRQPYLKGGAAALSTDFAPYGDDPTNFDGDNPGFIPSGGGDPLSVWLPRQDTRYPKQSRFPSVGALNTVRTGRIPDDNYDPNVPPNEQKPLDEQKGVPYRSINFSASSSASQTVTHPDKSGSYPDWAMLDLFTVPFLPQRPYAKPTSSPAETPPLRKLTFGGATEGKVNINNPRIPYPFDQTFPGVTQTPPTRTSPLDALFYGIKVSGGAADVAYKSDREPNWQTVDHVVLRDAVLDYLSANGPFILPGQLADVPAIDDYTYTGNGTLPSAPSRNDLLRKIVGATTTQSNTFSVWVVVQTVKKSASNANYGIFEVGDIVTSEVRRRYVVERFIETGKDGVPGNAKDPGPDGIVGTADDPLDDDYNPAMTYPLPYRWRIMQMEETL